MIEVSVIVPIYNVEKYLEKCINSLLSQTLEDIQIILVNDGSKDNSGNIAKEYEQNNKDRVIYVEKENGGLSDARNVGIENSKGKYETSPAKLQKPSINLPLTISPAPAFKEIA